MKDYIALTKPRITWLILMSTGVGYFFGAQTTWHGWAGLHWLALFISFASPKSTTQARPLPSGRLEARKALAFAIAISVAGFGELWFGANALCALLGLFTLLLYLFVYTPLKQRSPHSTTVGSVPGAMPPLIGAHRRPLEHAASAYGPQPG